MSLRMKCAGCLAPLSHAYPESNRVQACSACQAVNYLTIFPAATEIEQAARAEAVHEDLAEASCFFHDNKQAEVSCEQCGRFLCGLCRIDIGSEVRCPDCLTEAKNKDRSQKHNKGDLGRFTDRATRYDNIVLWLAICPITLIGVYFFWLTAPLAIIFSILWWNKPNGMVKHGRIKYVLAILFAIPQCILMVWLLSLLIAET